MLRILLRWIVLPALLINLVYSFYLPGLAPVNFCEANQKKAKCPVSLLNVELLRKFVLTSNCLEQYHIIRKQIRL